MVNYIIAIFIGKVARPLKRGDGVSISIRDLFHLEIIMILK